MRELTGIVMELIFIKFTLRGRRLMFLPILLGMVWIGWCIPHQANAKTHAETAETESATVPKKAAQPAKTESSAKAKKSNLKANVKAIKLFSHAPANHPERALLASIVAEWNRQKPSIQVTLMPPPEAMLSNPLINYFAVDEAERSNLTDELPDIADFYDLNYASVAARDGLLPLNQFLPQSLMDSFQPAFIRLGQYPKNGYVYAVPMIENSIAIWARKSALKAIDARIPTSVNDAWSQDEFDDVLVKLAALPKVTYPLDVGLQKTGGVWNDFAFVPWVMMMGGDLLNPTTQKAVGSMNSPAAIEAMTYLRYLLKRKLIAPADATRDAKHPLATIPLLASGPWMASLLRKAHKDDFLLLPMPKLGKERAVASAGWMYGISKKSQYPNESAEFLAFLLSPRKIGDMSNRLGGVPATRDALKYARNYRDKASLKIFLDQFADSPKLQLAHPNYALISNEFSQAVQTIIQGGNIEETLAQAATNIDNTIATEHKQ